MSRLFNRENPDAITAPVNGSLGSVFRGSFTISLWVRPSMLTPADETQTLLDRSDSNADCSIILHSVANGGVSMWIADNSSGFNYAYSVDNEGQLPVDEWTHLAMTYDADTGSVENYRNGVLMPAVDSGSQAGGFTDFDALSFKLGGASFWGHQAFSGNLADLRIWRRRLTQSAINGVMAGGSRRATDLVGWWPLCGAESPEPDLTANGNDGVLTGTSGGVASPVDECAMSAGAMSTYLRNELRKHLFRTGSFSKPTELWVSLHTASPGLTGANEADYAGYGRVQRNPGDSNWTAPADGAAANAATIAFPAPTSGSQTVSHFGLWDAQTGGNFLGGAKLDAVRWLSSLNTGPEFAAGDLSALFA